MVDCLNLLGQMVIDLLVVMLLVKTKYFSSPELFFEKTDRRQSQRTVLHRQQESKQTTIQTRKTNYGKKQVQHLTVQHQQQLSNTAPPPSAEHMRTTTRILPAFLISPSFLIIVHLIISLFPRIFFLLYKAITTNTHYAIFCQ